MTQPLISNRTRRIVLSGFFFFTGICFASWASRIPDIKMQLGLNDAELGAMLFFLPVGSFLGIPISGSLTSIYGSNRMLKIAAIIYPFLDFNWDYYTNVAIGHMLVYFWHGR